MEELEVYQHDIKTISELVINQIDEFSKHPFHNEYMRLAHNIWALEERLKELSEYMKYNKTK